MGWKENSIVAAIFGSIAGAFVSSVITWKSQSNATREAIGIAAIQTRVSTCTALASHYNLFAVEGEDVGRALVNDNEEKISNNFERREASINMARALDLCLISHTGLSEIKKCILKSTTDGNGRFDDYVRVLDSISGTEKNNQLPQGKYNAAC